MKNWGIYFTSRGISLMVKLDATVIRIVVRIYNASSIDISVYITIYVV